jgi:hypothetical protein
VIRRTVVPVAALGAAVLVASLLSGCTTFTDNGVAARVGENELSQDDLDTLLAGASPDVDPDEPSEVAADTARSLISSWIVTEVLLGDIDANGGEVSDTDRQAAADELSANPGWEGATAELQALQIDQTAAITVWSAIPPSVPSEDELRAIYEQGIEASGIACTAHILVETRAEADEVTAELDGGADFAEVAAERSTDTGSAENGGVIPCDAASTFRSQYVPEYVEAALAAEIGVPTEPVESEFGFHVILVRPFDDVADEGIDQIYNDINARFGRAAAAADVHVDPRIGTFDPAAGVVPLG